MTQQPASCLSDIEIESVRQNTFREHSATWAAADERRKRIDLMYRLFRQPDACKLQFQAVMRFLRSAHAGNRHIEAGLDVADTIFQTAEHAGHRVLDANKLAIGPAQMMLFIMIVQHYTVLTNIVCARSGPYCREFLDKNSPIVYGNSLNWFLNQSSNPMVIADIFCSAAQSAAVHYCSEGRTYKLDHAADPYDQFMDNCCLFVRITPHPSSASSSSVHQTTATTTATTTTTTTTTTSTPYIYSSSSNCINSEDDIDM
jgi:hypothetical protein